MKKLYGSEAFLFIMLYFAAVALFALILTGCAGGTGSAIKNGPAYRNAEPGAVRGREINLQKAAEKINGVKRAGVIITGNEAIIGITPANNSKADMTALKRKIEKAVKSADAKIDHVTVAADPGLTERIIKTQTK